MNNSIKNKEILDRLFFEKKIRLHRGKLFDLDVKPKGGDFDFNRVKGMLLGIAIGDALGNTSEGMGILQRQSYYGEITDYIPGRLLNDDRGFPSDDTQLSFWTLEQLIEDRGFDPEKTAQKFADSGPVFGIGGTVKGFLSNLRAGMPWYRSGPESAGNGALMRIAPMLIPHLKTGGTEIWADTALSAMMTHNDYASISACLAFVRILWELLDMEKPPAPEWWVRRYAEAAKDLEKNAQYTPSIGKYLDYRGPLCRFVLEKTAYAYSNNLTAAEACESWHSGAFLLETVPSVLYILMLHSHDPEEAIVRAVNDTKDNDTIAAIVGAAVGALHGKDSYPENWIKKLSGRTSENNDHQVFRLIDKAEEVFGT